MITRSETKIKVKSFNKATLVIRMTLLVLVLVTLLGFFTFDYKGIHVFDGIVLTGQTFLTMFLEPHFSHFTFVELISKLFITIGLAILTTMLGAAISLFLALVAAGIWRQKQLLISEVLLPSSERFRRCYGY